MAFVLDTAPVGAINSYSDLIAEIRDLQDNSAYSVDAIARAVRKSEAYFLRRIRLADMEVATTLSVTASTATLPADCKEIRTLVWLGTGQEYPLAQMSLSALADQYGGYSGVPVAYAREGRTLRFGAVGNGTARLVYYAGLTPLSDDFPSNWLLTKAPDLYVAGCQYYLARRERDDKEAGRALSEMDAILQSLLDENNRLAGGDLVPRGVIQVAGGRA